MFHQEDLRNLCPKVRNAERLLKESVKHAGDHVSVGKVKTRHPQDADVGVSLADHLAHVAPVKVRHVVIGDNEVNVWVQLWKSVDNGICRSRDPFDPAEVVIKESDCDGVVVNEENNVFIV